MGLGSESSVLYFEGMTNAIFMVEVEEAEADVITGEVMAIFAEEEDDDEELELELEESAESEPDDEDVRTGEVMAIVVEEVFSYLFAPKIY